MSHDNEKTKKQLINEIAELRRQIHDISEQKETEKTHRSRDKQFHRAEEIAQIGSFVVDEFSGKIKWSDQVYRMLGVEPGEIKSDNEFFCEFVHPEDRDRMTEEASKMLAGKADMDIEYRIIRKDGQLRVIHTQSDSEFDDHGNLAYIWGFSQDITERKQAEKALKESERRLSSHLQNTPIAAIEWNLDFEVLEWNAAAERVFGYTKDEALGRHAAGLIVPESAREHVNRVWNGLLENSGGFHSTNENFTKDG